uniref:Uncharacterized protein n=1 Tax=Anguilla anguilla TaxID=7936 RepID=A0A0E9PEZ0_ANGAN
MLGCGLVAVALLVYSTALTPDP